FPMNPLPPVTSMRVMLRVHFKLNYSKSRCSTLRMPFDDDGEIAPKAQRNKQLRHDKHWSEQQVGRIVDQRRLPPLEHAVSNNLRCDANGNQEGRKRPHSDGRHMTDD